MLGDITKKSSEYDFQTCGLKIIDMSRFLSSQQLNSFLLLKEKRQ